VRIRSAPGEVNDIYVSEAWLSLLFYSQASSEFPRISFVGNSYSCIETGMFEGYGYCRSLPTLTLKVVLFSESARSVLTSLGLAAACNADRILIHDAA
jgi:hypothetical protein